ncbi:MAG: hypothetical protein KAW39_01230 [Thermoplasmata archaeon]|nr:hypothetical protein [Thermoplasmata archaeon]
MFDRIPTVTESLVAIGTLILAFMVYLQIRESRRASAREIDAEDLKVFLTHWRG